MDSLVSGVLLALRTIVTRVAIVPCDMETRHLPSHNGADHSDTWEIPRLDEIEEFLVPLDDSLFDREFVRIAEKRLMAIPQQLHAVPGWAIESADGPSSGRMMSDIAPPCGEKHTTGDWVENGAADPFQKSVLQNKILRDQILSKHTAQGETNHRSNSRAAPILRPSKGMVPIDSGRSNSMTVPNHSESHRSGRAARCAACEGKFGLVRHYSWRTSLCSKNCVDRFRARRECDHNWVGRLQFAFDQLPNRHARSL